MGLIMTLLFTNILLTYREDKERFHFPTDIEGAKDLGRVLSKYKNSHYYTVLGGIIVTYILYPHEPVAMTTLTYKPPQ